MAGFLSWVMPSVQCRRSDSSINYGQSFLLFFFLLGDDLQGAAGYALLCFDRYAAVRAPVRLSEPIRVSIRLSALIAVLADFR
jgi:hypothetical protein